MTPIVMILTRFTLPVILCGIFCLTLPADPTAQPLTPVVVSGAIKGPINPGSQEYLERLLDSSQRVGAAITVIRLDTPGGLVSSLRNMVQDLMASPVPVCVFVTPSGAQAASAGALLTLSAHVAAMSPGTNIGAAHPVGIGTGGGKGSTMAHKAENDLAAMARSIAAQRGRNPQWAEDAVRNSVSASASEALELGVIDLMAHDLDELIQKLQETKIQLNKKEVTLDLRGAKVIEVYPNLREKVLTTLSDPNIAYILLMIGLTGIYFELAHPGVILPGIAGAVCLILAFFAMQTLPVSATGLILVALGVIFFVLELFVTSYGLLGASGAACLVLGSIMLFNPSATGVGIDVFVLWPTVLTVAAFFVAVLFLVARAAARRPESGLEALVGSRGRAQSDINGSDGKVFVEGEIWNAVSHTHITSGQTVRVKDARGLTLVVEPAKEGGP